jgi:MoxR-like ATPase
MAQKSTKSNLYKRLEEIINYCSQDLLERDETIRLSLLAIAAGESVFLLGPPGGAKSLLARRLTSLFQDGRYFEYLMGRFSTPEEIFGPIDINKLKDQGIYERKIQGYLAEADLAFLDEIWKASPPIQNSLLTALEERKFKNGTEVLDLPLKAIIAASNTVGDSSDTKAFWDRFLLRLSVQAVQKKENFVALINQKSTLSTQVLEESNKISSEEWEHWQQAVDDIQIGTQVENTLWQIRKTLSGQEHYSDRRWKKIARLLKFSALFHDRSSVSVLDCFIVPHCLWNKENDIESQKELCQQIIREIGYEKLIDLVGLESKFNKLHQSKGSEIKAQDLFDPTVYENEYFEVQETINGKKARIWMDDWSALEKNRIQEVEFFLYEKGQLLGTTSIAIFPTDEPNKFLIDDAVHTIQGSFRTEDANAIQLDQKDLDQMKSELIEQVQTYLKELNTLLKNELELAKRHLFVSIEETDPVFQTIEEQILRLIKLEKELTKSAKK